MSIRCIDNRLGLSGYNLKFNKEDLYGLKPGEKVTQIGDGRENGSFRTDFFKYPVEYVGSIMCQFKELEKMFAFKILISHGEPCELFFLYGSTGFELFTEIKSARNNNFVRFYVPEFKIYNYDKNQIQK